jgi:hypothetical protein
LNDVVAFTVRNAFLNLHCLATSKAAQEINQRAFIVVQSKSVCHYSALLKPWPQLTKTRYWLAACDSIDLGNDRLPSDNAWGEAIPLYKRKCHARTSLETSGL